MPAFWYIGLVAVFQQGASGIVLFYVLPYLTGLGLDRSAASGIVMMWNLVSLAGRIPVGIMADRFQKRHVMAFTVALMGVASLLFILVDARSPLWLTLLFVLAFGVGVTGISVVRPPMLVSYFGTRNFGAIYGLASIFSTVASISAAPLAGLYIDATHSYTPVWLFLAGFSAVATFVLLIMPRPAVTREAADSISR